MLFEGRVIGLVALKSLDGDVAQFVISRGELHQSPVGQPAARGAESIRR